MALNVQPMAAGAAAAAPNTVSRVEKPTVTSAVSALLKHKAATASDKLQLLPQDDYIYLNLTFKKIPSNPSTKPFKIPLPHPILDFTSQVCLIIDDRPQTTTPPSDQIKKLIKSQDIPISKVIKISKLKTNYKPFEAKRKLCDSYDLFLVDKRVVHLLPKLIGKEFFNKKKLPLGVEMGRKSLKFQVEKALGSALFYLRSGTCSVMKIGKVAMEQDEIVENVVHAIKGAVERVPKKWDGVRSLHLKFSDSVALPVYQAMPDVKLKIEGLKEIEKRAELVKTSDSEGEAKDISGKKDGKSGKRKKGRMHEVRYMDAGEKESDEEGVDNDALVGEKVVEESDGVEAKKIEDLSVDESVGKKRNKVKALKEDLLAVLNGEKHVKKKAKSEKSPKAGKPKKDEVSNEELPVEVKRKKKKSLVEKRSESVGKVKNDGKHKKRVSAK